MSGTALRSGRRCGPVHYALFAVPSAWPGNTLRRSAKDDLSRPFHKLAVASLGAVNAYRTRRVSQRKWRRRTRQVCPRGGRVRRTREQGDLAERSTAVDAKLQSSASVPVPAELIRVSPCEQPCPFERTPTRQPRRGPVPRHRPRPSPIAPPSLPLDCRSTAWPPDKPSPWPSGTGLTGRTAAWAAVTGVSDAVDTVGSQIRESVI